VGLLVEEEELVLEAPQLHPLDALGLEELPDLPIVVISRRTPRNRSAGPQAGGITVMSRGGASRKELQSTVDIMMGAIG